LGIGDLTVYSDPKDDPYLDPSQEDEDQEDKDDFNIRFVFVQMFPFLISGYRYGNLFVSADHLRHRTVKKPSLF
jgi:hypothetical protein